MKVLMISLERSLLGEQTGTGDVDVIQRHVAYGQAVDELNIIVLTKQGYQQQQLSDTVFVYPTNSKTRYHYYRDAFKMAKKIYNDEPYDLVIADFFTAWPAWRLQKKFKVKFLMHFHGDFWQNISGLEKKWSNYFLLALSKFLARQADAIRVVSSGIKSKMFRAGINRNKIHVISTPVNLEPFKKFDSAKVFEIKEKYAGKIILFTGRLEKVKNLSWFINVFQHIKQEYNDVHFLIVGQGSQHKNLANKIKKLNLEKSVHLVGRVNHDELTNYYHSADIFVLPSLSESFGKVLIEAGMAGLPCVASKTTGAKEIIQHEKTGFLVPINNEKQMKDKILELLNHSTKAQSMGNWAQKYVAENFNGEVQVEKIIKLWQELTF